MRAGSMREPLSLGEHAVEREAQIVHARHGLLFPRRVLQPPARPNGLPIHTLRSLPTCCKCRLATPWLAQWLPR